MSKCIFAFNLTYKVCQQSYTRDCTLAYVYLLSRCLVLVLCFIYILLWRYSSSWSMADAWGIITVSKIEANRLRGGTVMMMMMRMTTVWLGLWYNLRLFDDSDLHMSISSALRLLLLATSSCICMCPIPQTHTRTHIDCKHFAAANGS